MPNIQDTFRIFIPVDLPAEIEMVPPDSARVRYGEEFELRFRFKAGIPRATDAFYVNWMASDFVLRWIGYPTILFIIPSHPETIRWEDKHWIRPDEWQYGRLRARAPARPIPAPPGFSPSSTITYSAELNMFQPNPRMP